MSANFEQTAVLHQGQQSARKMAYDRQITKAFEQHLLSRVEPKTAPQDADPRYLSFKNARHVTAACLISLIESKNLNKLKTAGSRYSNGDFEIKQSGCSGAKSSKYTVSLDYQYAIEQKPKPTYSKVPWDSNCQFRLLLRDVKNAFLIAAYSNDEFDMLKIEVNINFLKIESIRRHKPTEDIFLAFRKVAVQSFKTTIAEHLFTSLLSMAASSQKFKEQDKFYQSQIADTEYNYTKKDPPPADFRPKNIDIDYQEPDSSLFYESQLQQLPPFNQFEQKVAHKSILKHSKTPAHGHDRPTQAPQEVRKKETAFQPNIDLPSQLNRQLNPYITSHADDKPKISSLVQHSDPRLDDRTDTGLFEDPFLVDKQQRTIKVDRPSTRQPVPKQILKKKPPTAAVQFHDQSSQLASTVSSSTKKRNYFAGTITFEALHQKSGVSDAMLVDVKQMNQISGIELANQDTDSLNSFVIASTIFPSTIDPTNCSLDICSFGLQLNLDGSSVNLDKSTLNLSRHRLRLIRLDSKPKISLLDTDQFIVQLDELIEQSDGLSEFFEVNLVWTDKQILLGSCVISHDLLSFITRIGAPFTLPISFAAGPVLLTLQPTKMVNNRERKLKLISSYTSNILQTRKSIPDLPARLDFFINTNIKHRQTEGIDWVYLSHLPSNVLLCIWLLVTKKFKPKSSSSHQKSESAVVNLSSSILRSLYVSRKDQSSLEMDNRVSLHFHKMLRNLEKHAELVNSNPLFKLNPLMESAKGEYFRSGLNRYKILDFIFSKMMSDYFNMFVDDANGVKNILFSRSFRSCSRDHMLLHAYLNLYCENVLKVSHLASKDLVLWAVDHILSLNIGFLREPHGYSHINFLFVQSMKHKDDPFNGYGWRVNLYLHIFVLSRLEIKLEASLHSYLGSAVTIDKLYSQVVDSPNFYDEFVKAYLSFEVEAKSYRSESKKSVLDMFIEAVTVSKNMSAIMRAEDLFLKMNESEDLRKCFEINVLENITVYQVSKLDLKPNKMINVLKPNKFEKSRKIFLKVHSVLHKEFEEEDLFFTVSCEGVEFEADAKNKFSIVKSSAYSPNLEIKMHRVGDELLYRNNETIIGSNSLQLRRFKSNIVHSLFFQITHHLSGREYILKLSVLVLEVASVKQDLSLADSNSHFKYLGSLGYLLMNGFKHPVTNFESLILKKLAHQYDELGLDIGDEFLNSKFSSASVTGLQVVANVKGESLDKPLRFAEIQLQTHFDSFMMSLKVLLFRKNFELLEDYIIRYYGSEANSITAPEAVHVLQSLLRVIGVRVHLLELVAYIERVIKKPISPKLVSCSILLGALPNGRLSENIRRTEHLDIKSAIVELISYTSFKRNCCQVPFGDYQELYLIRDVVDKMHMHAAVSDSNILSIKYDVAGALVTELLSFDQNFKAVHHLNSQFGHIDLDDLLSSKRLSVSLAPIDTIRITKPELRKIFTQVSLIDYLRFTTQSVQS